MKFENFYSECVYLHVVNYEPYFNALKQFYIDHEDLVTELMIRQFSNELQRILKENLETVMPYQSNNNFQMWDALLFAVWNDINWWQVSVELINDIFEEIDYERS